MNESCHTYVSCMNESRLTYEWVMSHIWMSHVTHINESCLMCEWVMSHVWMSHVPRTNESCHTHDVAWSHTCSTSQWSHPLTHLHYPFFLILSLACVSHMNESCPMYEWVMSHVWISHVTHMTSHMVSHLQYLTIASPSHTSILHLLPPTLSRICLACKRVMSHVWMSHVPCTNESCLIYEWRQGWHTSVTGWRKWNPKPWTLNPKP